MVFEHLLANYYLYEKKMQAIEKIEIKKCSLKKWLKQPSRKRIINQLQYEYIVTACSRQIKIKQKLSW